MDNFQNIFGIVVAGFYWLLTAGVTARVIALRNPVSVTLAWLLVIFILPVVGAILYLLVGELNLGRKRAERAAQMVEPYLGSPRSGSYPPASLPGGELTRALDQLLITQVGIAAQSYADLRLLGAAEAIFDELCRDVRSAVHNIRIETYIWHPGGRVDELVDELVEACRRGVRVSLLLDHAGSRPFFRSNACTRLQEAGAEVVAALPVRPLRALAHRIDLRLHRKLIVIDDRVAYTGSMNIADPAYFKQDAEVGQWIDVMLRVDGQAAAGLAKVFAWDWEVETGERYLPASDLGEASHSKWLMVIPSGPGNGEDLIGQAVLLGIYRANQQIIISTPYFVPSEAILDALCQAARRGVRVKLLLPRRNDSVMVNWASRAYFAELLDAGVEIHLFYGGLLHTKAMLMDDQLALVGSVNLDIRSLQLNFELTVAVTTPEGCRDVANLLASYQASSERLMRERWEQRSRAARALERLMYFMSPLL
ncbi:cardiolipin synthetase 2 [Halopseudomonas xinjiangensis]|uniref:Cardiolipin synthase n=1 Tax=Halopseudomonas xinjiangensis TaxID=487184 RepID=A0A1H1R6S3_9GAMM|nr:cardiolipin synthase [Halopseudomonas xinjiangensis]SDS31441.1 cardiolipin synthetase 2 [Halopseudomonas xinjiangensis]